MLSLLLRGPRVAFAAPDDDPYAADWEDPDDDAGQGQGDQDDQDPDDDGQDDLNDFDEGDEGDDGSGQDAEPQEPQRPQRKSFSQRVNEQVERRTASIREDILNEVRSQQQQQQQRQPQETPEQARERINNMDQGQFAQFILGQMDQRAQNAEFAARDVADKAALDAEIAGDKRLAPFKAKVESRLAELRRNGQNVDRITLLNHEIGLAFREGKTRSTNRAQKAADANRQRQTARPTGGRSDTGRTTETNTSTSARDKRLEGRSI